MDSLREGAPTDEDDDVDGVEVYLASEAASEIGLWVSSGIEFVAAGAEESEESFAMFGGYRRSGCLWGADFAGSEARQVELMSLGPYFFRLRSGEWEFLWFAEAAQALHTLKEYNGESGVVSATGDNRFALPGTLKTIDSEGRPVALQ